MTHGIQVPQYVSYGDGTGQLCHPRHHYNSLRHRVILCLPPLLFNVSRETIDMILYRVPVGRNVLRSDTPEPY